MHSEKFLRLNEAGSFKLVRIVDALLDRHELKEQGTM